MLLLFFKPRYVRHLRSYKTTIKMRQNSTLLHYCNMRSFLEKKFFLERLTNEPVVCSIIEKSLLRQSAYVTMTTTMRNIDNVFGVFHTLLTASFAVFKTTMMDQALKLML